MLNTWGLGRYIFMPLPNQDDRLAILKLHTQNTSLESSIKLNYLAKFSEKFSGDELVGWLKQAEIHASRANEDVITLQHLGKARDSLKYGFWGEPHSNKTKRLNTAIHEAGHALIARLMGIEVLRLSVRDHTSAGFSGKVDVFFEHPTCDITTFSRNWICIYLAGRAAELLHASPQLGSDEDISKAKKTAKSLILNGLGRSLSGYNQDAEIEAILQTEMARAIHLIKIHQKTHEQLVNTLVEQHEIYQDEFYEICKNLPEETPHSANAGFRMT